MAELINIPDQFREDKSKPLFPEFPTEFTEKEASRLEKVDKQYKQMEEAYQSTYKPEKWDSMPAPHKWSSELFQQLRDMKVVGGLMPAITPEVHFEDFTKLKQEYDDLSRRNYVTTRAPEIKDTLYALRMQGVTFKELGELPKYFPELTNQFTPEERANIEAFNMWLLQASPEELARGQEFGLNPINADPDYTELFNKEELDPRYILSTVAFNQDINQIKGALINAYPANVQGKPVYSEEQAAVDIELLFASYGLEYNPDDPNASMEELTEAQAEQDGFPIVFFDPDNNPVQASIHPYSGDVGEIRIDGQFQGYFNTNTNEFMPINELGEPMTQEEIDRRENIGAGTHYWNVFKGSFSPVLGSLQSTFQTDLPALLVGATEKSNYTTGTYHSASGGLVDWDSLNRMEKVLEEGLTEEQKANRDKFWDDFYDRNKQRLEGYEDKHKEIIEHWKVAAYESFKNTRIGWEKPFSERKNEVNIFQAAMEKVVSIAPGMLAAAATVATVTLVTRNPMLAFRIAAPMMGAMQAGDYVDTMMESGYTYEESIQALPMLVVILGGLEGAQLGAATRLVAPTLLKTLRKEALSELATMTRKQMVLKGLSTAVATNFYEAFVEVAQDAVVNVLYKQAGIIDNYFEGLSDTFIDASIGFAPMAIGGFGGQVSYYKSMANNSQLEIVHRRTEELIENGQDAEVAERIAVDELLQSPEGSSLQKLLVKENKKLLDKEKHMPKLVQEANEYEIDLRNLNQRNNYINSQKLAMEAKIERADKEIARLEAEADRLNKTLYTPSETDTARLEKYKTEEYKPTEKMTARLKELKKFKREKNITPEELEELEALEARIKGNIEKFEAKRTDKIERTERSILAKESKYWDRTNARIFKNFEKIKDLQEAKVEASRTLVNIEQEKKVNDRMYVSARNELGLRVARIKKQGFVNSIIWNGLDIHARRLKSNSVGLQGIDVQRSWENLSPMERAILQSDIIPFDESLYLSEDVIHARHDIKRFWNDLEEADRVVYATEAGIAKTSAKLNWKDLSDVQQTRLEKSYIKYHSESLYQQLELARLERLDMEDQKSILETGSSKKVGLVRLPSWQAQQVVKKDLLNKNVEIANVMRKGEVDFEDIPDGSLSYGDLETMLIGGLKLGGHNFAKVRLLGGLYNTKDVFFRLERSTGLPFADLFYNIKQIIGQVKKAQDSFLKALIPHEKILKDKDSIDNIRNYINNKREDLAPEDKVDVTLTDKEKAAAEELEKIFDSYKPKVSVLAFEKYYERQYHAEGERVKDNLAAVTSILNVNPDVTSEYNLAIKVAGLVSDLGVKMRDSNGNITDFGVSQVILLKDAVKAYEQREMDTFYNIVADSGWGTIKGYTPYMVVDPSLSEERTSITTRGSARLEHRTGVVMPPTTRNLGQDVGTYVFQVEAQWQLRDSISTLSSMLEEIKPKFRDADVMMRSMEQTVLEIQQLPVPEMMKEASIFFMRIHKAFNLAVFNRPTPILRNFLQAVVFHPYRTWLFRNPRNYMSADQLALADLYYKNQVSQMGGINRTIFYKGFESILASIPGLRAPYNAVADWLDSMQFYSYSDEIPRRASYMAGVNRAQQAIKAYKEHGDVDKLIRDSGIDHHQREAINKFLEYVAYGDMEVNFGIEGLAAVKGYDAAAMLNGSEVADFTHFNYDRWQRASIEQGALGRTMWNMLTFTRSYWTRHYQNFEKIFDKDTTFDVKLQSFKDSGHLFLFGLLGDLVVSKAFGKAYKSYFLMDILYSDVGGLFVGGLSELFNTFSNLGQFLFAGEDDPDKEKYWGQFTAGAKQSEELTIPLLNLAIRAIELPIGYENNLERDSLNRLRAWLDGNYTAKEIEQKEYNLINGIQHIIANARVPEPSLLEQAQMDLDLGVSNLGSYNLKTGQVYLLNNLANEIDSYAKQIPAMYFNVQEDFDPLVEFYMEFYYTKKLEYDKLPTAGDVKMEYRKSNLEFEAMSIFWGKEFEKSFLFVGTSPEYLEVSNLIKMWDREYGIDTRVRKAMTDMSKLSLIEE